MKNIYLLSCVKTKLSKPSVAVDMYISPLFKKMLSYAQSKEADEIFILSAEYGLLERSQVIDPYEKTLRTMKKKEREMEEDGGRGIERRKSCQKRILVSFVEHWQPFREEFCEKMRP